MSKGISNFQIENALKNMSDEDINDNFVDVFSSNHMNTFIDHAAMISEKRENISSLLQMRTVLKKGELTLGVYLILSQKQTFSSLILLD